MISLQCKKYKETFKIFVCENTKLKKSNEDLKKEIQTLEESLSLASKTDKSSTTEKLRDEISCLTKDFVKFLESSISLAMLLKFHQHPHDKILGLKKEHHLLSHYLSQTNVTYVVSLDIPSLDASIR